MLALSTYMRYEGPDPLGGVIGLLGYEPLPVDKMYYSGKQYEKAETWQPNTPLLLYNGIKDKLSPATFVKDTYLHFDRIYSKNKANNIQIMEAGLSHETSPKMITRVKEFLNSTLAISTTYQEENYVNNADKVTGAQCYVAGSAKTTVGSCKVATDCCGKFSTVADGKGTSIAMMCFPAGTKKLDSYTTNTYYTNSPFEAFAKADCAAAKNGASILAVSASALATAIYMM